MIYFIRSPEGRIKIGTTIGLSDRLPQLIREYGEGLEVLAVTEGSYPRESELHLRFSHLNVVLGVSREWFEPGEDLLQFIATEGKPWQKPRLLTVMIDRPISSKAKAVAQHLGLSMAEVISDAARVNVDRMYAKMLRELDESGQ